MKKLRSSKEKCSKNKTYRVTYAFIGNYKIEAFESGKMVLNLILNDYNVDGACRVLDTFGYRCTKRGF